MGLADGRALVACLWGRSFLTAEEGLVVSVRGWQLADVLGPEAHDPGEVAGVVQTAHDDAVQVHRLNEVAEQCTLQSQHVPPARRGRQCGAHLCGRAPPSGLPPHPPGGGLCAAPVPAFPPRGCAARPSGEATSSGSSGSEPLTAVRAADRGPAFPFLEDDLLDGVEAIYSRRDLKLKKKKKDTLSPKRI